MAPDRREVVRQRAQGRCEYCRLQDQADEWPFHVDHVVAIQHGGETRFENLCWSCSRCNLFKGPNLNSLDPHSGASIPLFHPRHDKWHDHFRLDAGRVVGITPTGRATVRLLVMNASSRVELRRKLIELGEF